MSFFRTSYQDAKTKLPLPTAPVSSTGTRQCTDWQLTPHPIDGPIRQGKRSGHINRDSNNAPILTAQDLCMLIKGIFRHLLHPKERKA
jgi:hypothetical protein